MSKHNILPRLLGDRYRVETKLGQGGMGVVYGGIDLRLQRPVAVKLISGSGNQTADVHARFLREAKNTARLEHPHIVQVYDMGHTEQGEMFFVMEKLDGRPLSVLLKEYGILPATVVVHIGLQLCDALGYAHKAGIIHRDLKPANIMLIKRAADPYFVKILDFGVAKSQDQSTLLTQAGMLVGTVEYVSPEQIMGLSASPLSDLYAVGVVLYRMLSGTLLFKESVITKVIQAHLSLAPESLLKRAPRARIWPELDRVVLRCLAKRPQDRFPSMEELAVALAQSMASSDHISKKSSDVAIGDPTTMVDTGRGTHFGVRSKGNTLAFSWDDADSSYLATRTYRKENSQASQLESEPVSSVGDISGIPSWRSKDTAPLSRVHVERVVNALNQKHEKSTYVDSDQDPLDPTQVVRRSGLKIFGFAGFAALVFVLLLLLLGVAFELRHPSHLLFYVGLAAVILPILSFLAFKIFYD